MEQDRIELAKKSVAFRGPADQGASPREIPLPDMVPVDCVGCGETGYLDEDAAKMVKNDELKPIHKSC